MLLRNIDWTLWGLIAVLLGAGSLSLYSTAPEFFNKQLLWIGVGVVMVIGLLMLDLRSFSEHKGFVLGLYLAVVGLLVATYLFAPEIKGNRAWFVIGSFQFQPAEFAKIAVIVLLSYFFSKRHIGIARWKTVIVSFIYTAIPVGLIMVQPDLGSAMVLLAIWAGLVLLSGLPLKRVILFGLLAVIAAGAMWTWILVDYQKDRIVGVFSPERDPLGVNYSVIQSKIAIGSGGLFGKGLGQGTQVQLGFLPEAHADFIFAAIAEEGGMLAVLMVVGAFGWLLLHLLRIGVHSERNIVKFLCLGVVVMFLIQFILNVGSTIGVLPVVGVTLPFVSYGGSSVLANLFLVGMIQSLARRTM
jgi:rod shape determining protein RodA